MMATKLLGLGIAAIEASALLLPVGSGVAFAQVVASATGSGQIHVSGDLRTFTFNAQTDSLGVTTGQTRREKPQCGYPRDRQREKIRSYRRVVIPNDIERDSFCSAILTGYSGVRGSSDSIQVILRADCA